MAKILVNLEVEGETSRPICPHCGEELSGLHLTPGSVQVSSLASLTIDTFSCPRCRKVLSVSGRK